MNDRMTSLETGENSVGGEIDAQVVAEVAGLAEEVRTAVANGNANKAPGWGSRLEYSAAKLQPLRLPTGDTGSFKDEDWQNVGKYE